MGMYLPVPIVAAVLAFVYGRTIRHAWLSAVITFACVLLGGLISEGAGQIVGVVLSALIIFVAFTRPEQRRQAQEQAAKEKDARQLMNEEDI